MYNQPLPPHLQENDRVILFDGVCKFCNAWVRFIIRFDHQKIFKLCSVQSPEGEDILKHFGLPTDVYETLVYVEGSQYYGKSEAILKITSQLGWLWKFVSITRLLPKFCRDWLYDKIALNRYALFGRHEVCLLPTADYEDRFLNVVYKK